MILSLEVCAFSETFRILAVSVRSLPISSPQPTSTAWKVVLCAAITGTRTGPTR